MESETSTKRRTTSSNASEPSTSRSQLDYAMERAKVLFGCYRRGDANDPDQYVASIAAVLTLYEPALIREVTDPRTGISTDEKFATYMPNSGELKIYCDTIRERRCRYERLGSIQVRPLLPRYLDTTTPGRRANCFIAADNPQYQRALKWSEGADVADWKLDPEGRAGIWVTLNWLDAKEQIRDFKQPIRSLTDDDLRRLYPQREAAE